VNDADRTSVGDEVPQVPGHLHAVLGAAAREELRDLILLRDALSGSPRKRR
jgi:hypothetical protein